LIATVNSHFLRWTATGIHAVPPILLEGLNRKGAQIRVNQKGNIDGISVFYNLTLTAIFSQTTLAAKGAKVGSSKRLGSIHLAPEIFLELKFDEAAQ
jgi:hypothetical protein